MARSRFLRKASRFRSGKPKLHSRCPGAWRRFILWRLLGSWGRRHAVLGTAEPGCDTAQVLISPAFNSSVYCVKSDGATAWVWVSPLLDAGPHGGPRSVHAGHWRTRSAVWASVEGGACATAGKPNRPRPPCKRLPSTPKAWLWQSGSPAP